MLILINDGTIYNTETGRTIEYDPEGDGRAVLMPDGVTSDGNPITLYNGTAAKAWAELVDVADDQRKVLSVQCQQAHEWTLR